MHISLKLLAIDFIFIENGLMISFIPVALFISQETEGLYLMIRGKSKSYFFLVLLSIYVVGLT